MPLDLAELLDPAHTAVLTMELQRGVVGDASIVPAVAEQVAEQVASVFPRSSVSTIDRQTWMAAELPEPIPER